MLSPGLGRSPKTSTRFLAHSNFAAVAPARGIHHPGLVRATRESPSTSVPPSTSKDEEAKSGGGGGPDKGFEERLKKLKEKSKPMKKNRFRDDGETENVPQKGRAPKPAQKLAVPRKRTLQKNRLIDKEPEVLWYEGGPPVLDSMFHALMLPTIILTPVGFSALARAYSIRYEITSKRASIIRKELPWRKADEGDIIETAAKNKRKKKISDTRWERTEGGEVVERTDLWFKDVLDVKSVGRAFGFGDWGNMVVITSKGRKYEFQSIEKVQEAREYIIRGAARYKDMDELTLEALLKGDIKPGEKAKKSDTSETGSEAESEKSDPAKSDTKGKEISLDSLLEGDSNK